MNERIRETMGETLDKYFSHTWTVMDYEDVSKFAEKFAQLIVEECADICRNRKLAPSAFTADEILERFGVK